MKVGDKVTRMLAGTVPMKLTVTAVRDNIVSCAIQPDYEWGWDFDLKTGAEIDEDLNWGPPPLMTGSYLILNNDNTEGN